MGPAHPVNNANSARIRLDFVENFGPISGPELGPNAGLALEPHIDPKSAAEFGPNSPTEIHYANRISPAVARNSVLGNRMRNHRAL